MLTVLFVGLDHLAGKIDFGDGGQLRAVYRSTPDDALQTIGTERPVLIMANRGEGGSLSDDLVSMVRTCYPDLRSAIITVDADQPAEDVVISEYDEAQGTFYERNIPPRYLRAEIRRACGLDQATGDEKPAEAGSQEAPASPAESKDDSDADLEELGKVGRNEFVKRGERKFNIQTEVMVGNTVKIKTTIFEGGVLVDHNVQSFSRTERDLVQRLIKLAGSQHYDAVARVRRGRYD